MSTDPKMYEFLKNLNAEIKKWILPETEMKLVEVRVMTAKSSVQELSEVWSAVVRQRTLVSNSVTHLKLIMSNIRGVINSAADGSVMGQSILRSKSDLDRHIKMCETYVDSYKEYLESLKIAHEYYKSMAYLLGARITDI